MATGAFNLNGISAPDVKLAVDSGGGKAFQLVPPTGMTKQVTPWNVTAWDVETSNNENVAWGDTPGLKKTTGADNAAEYGHKPGTMEKDQGDSGWGPVAAVNRFFVLLKDTVSSSAIRFAYTIFGLILIALALGIMAKGAATSAIKAVS